MQNRLRYSLHPNAPFLEETRHCCVLPRLVSKHQLCHLSWSPCFKFSRVKKCLTSFKDLPLTRYLSEGTHFVERSSIVKHGVSFLSFLIFYLFLFLLHSFNLKFLYSDSSSKHFVIFPCLYIAFFHLVILTYYSQKLHPGLEIQCLRWGK